MRPKLLIVDDHDGFRDAARILLETEGFDVVGSVGTGEEALTETMRLAPDLVLLDIQLPGIDGFTTAHRLADLTRPPAVVLISSRDAVSFGAKIESAPIRGFLTKRELNGANLTGLIS